ncbi:ABC-three component system protein [Beijerinckia indica]|uniref:ABC-three component systems C-terminal domain-containing protein n=1 Tax=Beijerinckia indica subsp. indica (strain ATCC 9039 / DSM 1715 / NCIMB 8712) TaxID=395963 RepID=B2IKU4_BEII9|nr:ABC-three component system protein [Beijerinckia indica]ACB95132.1 conserved hypothetical protein [Beijerinckia indica subsp. indica ATCC 9039]
MANHSAADSASGYLYQCRYALLAALRQQDVTPGLQISIECFDDIAFSFEGTPVEMIQAKHSLRRKTMLDMAKQFWNTVGIWTKRVVDHPSELGKLKLTFVTTATLGPETGVALLRPDPSVRDVAGAAKKLEAAAQKSKNADIAWATKLFLEQSPEVREQILQMIEMLDASPTIVDTSQELALALKRACRPEHLKAFIERLEGWWFTIIIDALAAPGGKLIPVTMLDSKIDDLREEFGPARLPIDYGAADPSKEAVGLLETRTFVEQLKLIGLGATGQKIAIVDYFRAREQRSRWTRDGLLRQNELTVYSRLLTENWQRRKGIVESQIKNEMPADELAEMGLKLYADTTNNCVPIREVSEPFISQGSYHILSDRHVVGWHPHYETLLSAVNTEDNNDSALE